MSTKIQTERYVKYVHPARSEHAVVFDMDDTLARYCEEKTLFQCDQFAPIDEILAVAHEYQRNGYDIIIATARPSWCAYNSFKWLKKHGLIARAMYLKTRGTGTAPEVLKAEMLADVAKTWSVHNFYDDNARTCDAVAQLNIPVTHVAGNESFWSEYYAAKVAA